jgi:hypothetical protein
MGQNDSLLYELSQTQLHFTASGHVLPPRGARQEREEFTTNNANNTK